MATIDVRCEVRLPADIVLAAQKDAIYPAIHWQLANGDTVSVEMEVRDAEIRHSYQEHSSKGNWYVNSRVEVLRVSVRLEDVSADDLDRLYGRHTSARSFVARFKTNSGAPLDQPYQEALGLGHRVVHEIREAANRVLQFIRDNYGQHWVRLLSDEEKPIQNFLDEVRAEWREGTNPWKRLLVAHLGVVIKGARLGVANLYLETADWQSIQNAISTNTGPPDGFALLSDARDRYHQGDPRVAIIQMNSALEWAVQHFLRDRLGSKTPAKSLEELLKQSHSRVLDDWVLPLDREIGLGLEHNEWPSIKRVQELRREAGHPAVSGIKNLTDAEFEQLVRHSISTVVKLTGLPMPKVPLPMIGILSGGTV